MKQLLLAFGIALAFSACGTRDTWEGFVYPDRGDLTRHISLGAFQTLDECRAAALNALSERGDYECGKNCDFKEGMGELRVCEETLR